MDWNPREVHKLPPPCASTPTLEACFKGVCTSRFILYDLETIPHASKGFLLLLTVGEE